MPRDPAVHSNEPSAADSPFDVDDNVDHIGDHHVCSFHGGEFLSHWLRHSVRVKVPTRRVPVAGRGAWMIPLIGRSALQLIENQFAMLLECAEALFERMEQ
jgi:hypothetical protein